MPEIEITNLYNRKIITNSLEKTALEIIHENFIDWMHACGKKGRCTSCKMIIEKGQENLAELTKAEERFRNQNRLADNERLACQAVLKGDIKIKVAERNKFPHMDYSD
ncbi:2Fe-2S iron-sulfur cluster-binding protein [Marivirga arenosa]|jgi:2Fe-2S ferredoxin|uniref:2Fe-2S iron-sulfur cluster-binding protein n=1 Tax=Marivirga arenosa TaxID=3059076 RepID=A0AA51ZWF2_9BACT|nr:2Fe-2S iron-sulfur cluster-binding protein [Marivirga sp. BKB1-2]WNB17984.1 2Fe-2S iron-sulfur cluster-binding protein [Marivirga sp. BKB1-2]